MTLLEAVPLPEEAAVHGPEMAEETFFVHITGYEGPLDVLLSMAQNQKMDLRQVSVLQLAEQYLAAIDGARRLRIDLAADYLVMAAWLALLKSRLLLPDDTDGDGPSGSEMAAHLAFQLERLEAMRVAAARLMERPQLGRDFFARGTAQACSVTRMHRTDMRLVDLLRCYGEIRTQREFHTYRVDRGHLMSMERALEHMRTTLGYKGTWTELRNWLPEGWQATPEKCRSATAATFSAALELVRLGLLEIRQGAAFAPLDFRARTPA